MIETDSAIDNDENHINQINQQISDLGIEVDFEKWGNT